MSTDTILAKPALPRLSRTHLDRAAYPKGVAYLDGQFLPMSEAKISVLDWGFLHSDATYDTAHVWEGRFFRLDLHLDRFFAGMARLRMDPGLSRAEIAQVLEDCVTLSGHRNAYVEMICTRGSSETFSRDPRDATNRFMAFAVPFGSVANPEQMQRGLRLAISSAVRIPPVSVDPTIKNYHWLDLVRGLYDAYEQGAENAILLDYEGNIAEGPGFNIFALIDGTLVTPDRNVLPGITRRSVFDLAQELSIPLRQEPLSVAALGAATEVFITSTAGGIMPVSEIGGRPIGTGKPGPVTERLRSLYWKKHRDPAWSSAVDYSRGQGA